MKLTDKKRQAIIEAAIEEFQSNGFQGAKTTQIAKNAEVSSRTLYNHFESKEVLFQTIVGIIVEGKANWEAVPYDPSAALEEQFRAILLSYLDVVTEPGALAIARMVNSEALRDPSLAQSFYPKLAVYDVPIIHLINEAMEAGAMRTADANFAASQLFALIRGLFFWPELLLGEKQEIEGKLDDCIKMFLSHYHP